jgi:hypothetical protein
MPADEEWVKMKLDQIAHKRAVLSTLKDSLDAWERDVDWGELPEGKRQALLKLAQESATTLRELISRVNDQIASGLSDVARGGGQNK